MLISLLYVILAVLGLSILIFFHELGHYYMARHVGMKVETFSIGFGRPLYSWTWDGVKWQIGWLLFGGYVKIAGQDTEDGRDPYANPESFFGKSPWDRIKVAFAGPFVNLVLAFLLFAAIWAAGGRNKNFADYTHKIGWVDPKSSLYEAGIRPGDEIISYNQGTFNGAKDHLYVPMTSPGDVDVKALKIDYTTGQKLPFEYKVKTYQHPSAIEKGVQTTGIISSANYIMYNRLPSGQENPLPDGSPMQGSGIRYGDRIVWADGELVFSAQQLSHILNDGRVLLTVERNGKILQLRVPRVPVQELKMDAQFKEELTDWQYEAELNNVKLHKLYAIPYNLNNNAVVENELKFIDKDNELEAFPAHPYSKVESPLKPQDRILAVDGTPIKTSYQLLALLQKHEVNIIVERDKEVLSRVPSTEADEDFDREMNWGDINKIVSSIGTEHVTQSAGNFFLLKPIVPKMMSEFEISQEKKAFAEAELKEQKKEIDSIEDPERRARVAALLQSKEKQLLLGLPGIQDRKVTYNPSPMTQFASVFSEIWRTLVALVTGSLNPKWISGPIGIVQVVHDTYMVGFKEALYWLGAISLNLGILNLLPIPVLDGGTIMLSFIEIITGKRFPPKTLEKLILPFAALLIALFVFLTYNDLSRLFQTFFR